LRDEAATVRLGAQLAPLLEPGMRVYLSGQLGSGKTTLVRALLGGLGYAGRVKSPSYALVEAYVLSRLYLYHFDFYRFRSEAEWADTGFEEMFDSQAVCLVEWPEKAGELLPEPDIAIAFSPAAAGRRVVIEARSQAGGRCVSALRSSGGSF
jgi:tRNA threonylcarbamoyladenosine biosynthesis protein TsaE